MHYSVLACDYDGTLADEGALRCEVVQALQRCRDSGRRLVLVTGRVMEELTQVCERIDLFEYVVAENGGTLYSPTTLEEVTIAPPPAAEFVRRLRWRHIAPLEVGRVVVATWEHHATAILEVIRDMGLELQLIFNKGAVMVLPSGTNKWTGLQQALGVMQVSARNVVAVGDGENDHALLDGVGCGVAVASAVPTLRERANWVTSAPASAGVIELIERLVAQDLAGLSV